MKFRRTKTITDINWAVVYRAYEALHPDARIDSAVPQDWFDENMDELGRRLGACWLYDDAHRIFGVARFNDEILMGLGIHLGFEEDSDG